ncbi:MAG: GIY-YIG nuclease family protein [Gammaproteobacteria bacterium]|nr:GIY-YIG nuclease family protein [Gammaproteobacteria bacterium]
MKKEKPSAYLYLVGEQDTRYIKIGITSQGLMTRLRNIQTGNPRRLEFISCFLFQNREQAEDIESRVLGKHQNKTPHLTVGEWFYLPEDISFTEFFQRVLNMARDKRYKVVKTVHNPIFINYEAM